MDRSAIYSRPEAQAPAAATSLGEIANRLERLKHLLTENLKHTENIGDRAFGPQPQNASAPPPPKEVRSGTVGSLMDELENLFVLTQLNSAAIERLEQLA